MKKLLLLFSGLFLGQLLLAQHPASDNGMIIIGAGFGGLNYKGDIGSVNSSSLIDMRLAWSFHAEKRIGKMAGISLNGSCGKVSGNEMMQTGMLNFESSISQFDLRLTGHFDNDIFMPRNAMFAPFLSAGLGYVLFDPHGDMMDDDGNVYYYWDDGSIMDRPQNMEDSKMAVPLQRNYVYETQLTNEESYSRGALVFPLTLGLKFKLSEDLQTRFSMTWNLAQTDYMDNISRNGKNDRITHAAISLHYILGRSGKNEHNYAEVDFDALLQQDTDGDGISDLYDECQNTPEGIEIDAKGCPLDSDQDGVPDYTDSEPGSEPGAIVDYNGATITDEKMEERRLRRDSVFFKRVERFYEAPSRKKLKELDESIAKEAAKGEKKSIPEKWKFADFNENGIIESGEIERATDEFLSGELNITAETLQELIDYFFEQ